MSEGKKGFFGRLVEGLTKTRDNIVSGIDSIFSGFSAIDDDFYEEIEETLIMGDLGIQTTMAIVEDLRKKVKEQHIKNPSECKEVLIESIKKQMDLGENAYEFEHRRSVVLVIGVNGVGKTTSVGKLAGQLKDQGKKVVLAAADTFRAAAIEQLTEWATRAKVEIIAQQEGSDPAAVVYDAVAAAKSRQADVLICDTAGRLHNKKNLMEELKKIIRGRFQDRVDNYFYDNIIHISDNYYQSKLIDKILKLHPDITECFVQIKDIEYVLCKLDVPYMVCDFPKSFPIHKDADLLCKRESYAELVGRIKAFALSYAEDNGLAVRVLEESVRTKIRIEYIGFLIYQFDISFEIENLGEGFVNDAVNRRIWRNGIYMLDEPHEIEVRKNECILYPGKEHHKRYLLDHGVFTYLVGK